MEYLNDNQGFATSVAAFLTFGATVVLACITFVYTRYTKRIADSVNEPHLHAWVFPRDPTILILRIGNSGPGSAVDVETETKFSGSDRVLRWTWPYLAAGEARSFGFPGAEGKKDAYRPDDVAALGDMTFSATYHTANGRKRSTTRTSDLASAIASAKETAMRWTEDEPEMLPISIRDQLRKIWQSLDRLRGPDR